MSEVKLFDFIDDLSHIKRGILSEDNEKEYSSFMINSLFL